MDNTQDYRSSIEQRLVVGGWRRWAVGSWGLAVVGGWRWAVGGVGAGRLVVPRGCP